MAQRKTLARNWRFEVTPLDADGDYTGATWTRIRGIRSFNTDSNKDDADTSDFDSEGWNEHLPSNRGKSLTLEGSYMHDPDTGVREPGQALIETYDDAIDVEGLAMFRMYNKLTGKGLQGEASFTVGGPGGGTNDVASWSVGVTYNGKPERITVSPIP